MSNTDRRLNGFYNPIMHNIMVYKSTDSMMGETQKVDEPVINYYYSLLLIMDRIRAHSIALNLRHILFTYLEHGGTAVFFP